MSDLITIAGVSYGLEESIGKAALGDLYVLKVKHGLSIKTITATFAKFAGAASTSDDEVNPLDLLDDPEVLLNLQGIIWLAKRKVGENISFEDCGRFAFTDIEFMVGDDEEDAEDDPKETLKDSDLDESDEAAE